MPSTLRRTCLSLATVAALATAATPVAADQIAAGVVVKIDAREIYVNLGGHAGVVDGAELRLKRPILLRHPITRAPVKDWLPIGSATVTSAGESLAMAVLDDDLRTQVEVGDIAEIYVERAETIAPRPAPTPPPDPGTPIPTVDPDTAEVLRVWRTIAGKSLDQRIAVWEGWLSVHAGSPHAAAIRTDLDALRAQRDAAAPRRPTHGEASVTVAHISPSRAEAGRDLALVFVITDPARIASASLHYRAIGDLTYERVLLRRENDLYLRGTIPGDHVAAPGVEYFVEAAVPSGTSGAAFSTPGMPSRVQVDPPPAVLARFAGRRDRTRLSVMASYLDFANLDDRDGDRTDQFYLGEIDVLYRIDSTIYGVRAGFGSYGGKGGRANEVWDDNFNTAPTVGFQYGYAEVELRLPVKKGPPLGIATRFFAGVGDEGLGVGFGARARVGDPDDTNLSIGASSVEEIGFYSDLRLETWPDPRLPVGISVGMTDQPGNGDLGARLALDLGWRALSWLQPTLRLSWQGRTAVHSGVGGGLGMVFDW